jgi:hypothetical protein
MCDLVVAIDEWSNGLRLRFLGFTVREQASLEDKNTEVISRVTLDVLARDVITDRLTDRLSVATAVLPVAVHMMHPIKTLLGEYPGSHALDGYCRFARRTPWRKVLTHSDDLQVSSVLMDLLMTNRLIGGADLNYESPVRISVLSGDISQIENLP